MRLIFRLLLPLLLACTGCTHNDGDIGPWFGTWRLEEITVDGHPDESYGHDIFWQFQNTVFCMRKVTAMYDYYPRWGTWSETPDGMLEIDFSHHDDSSKPTIYTPFEETHLEQKGVSELKIISIKGGSMRLEYRADDGKVYGYSLDKW